MPPVNISEARLAGCAFRLRDGAFSALEPQYPLYLYLLIPFSPVFPFHTVPCRTPFSPSSLSLFSPFAFVLCPFLLFYVIRLSSSHSLFIPSPFFLLKTNKWQTHTLCFQNTLCKTVKLQFFAKATWLEQEFSNFMCLESLGTYLVGLLGIGVGPKAFAFPTSSQVLLMLLVY